MNWESGFLLTGKGGIQYGADAQRYIDGAKQLLSGSEIIGYRNSYLGYMALLALGYWMGFGLGFTLFVQVLFHLLAGLAMFYLLRKICSSVLPAIIGLCFYLTSPLCSSWVLCIHTESLYASMLLLSCWAIFQAINKRDLWYYLLCLLVVLCTCSIRPNAWMLLPIGTIFLLYFSTLNGQTKTIWCVVVLCVFMVFVKNSPWFSSKGEIERASNLLLKGEIICDKTTKHLAMPQEVFTGKNDLLEACVYLVKHPISSMKLASLRLFSELFPIHRPWLSNAFIFRFLEWTLPAYFFSLISLFFFAKHKALQVLFVVLLSQFLVIAATFAEREFRFLAHFLPILYLIGASGFYFLSKKIQGIVFQHSLE